MSENRRDEFWFVLIFIIGSVVGCFVARDVFDDKLIQQGRVEILTGKMICNFVEFKEDKPTFECKTKQELEEDIKFLNNCCQPKPQKKGSNI
jgi:hypothetical protein